MKRLLLAFIGLAAMGVLAAQPAWAQSAGCPVTLVSPVTVTAGTWTFSNTDNCKVLVFTNATTNVTMPNAATFATPGWRVTLKTTGTNGIYMTPTTSTLDGQASALHLTQGLSCDIASDSVNYWSLNCATHNP